MQWINTQKKEKKEKAYSCKTFNGNGLGILFGKFSFLNHPWRWFLMVSPKDQFFN
jgi:hypothetical protein